MKVEVSMYDIVRQILNAPLEDYGKKPISVIYVLKNGDVKVVYLNGDVILIPYEKEEGRMTPIGWHKFTWNQKDVWIDLSTIREVHDCTETLQSNSADWEDVQLSGSALRSSGANTLTRVDQEVAEVLKVIADYQRECDL